MEAFSGTRSTFQFGSLTRPGLSDAFHGLRASLSVDASKNLPGAASSRASRLRLCWHFFASPWHPARQSTIAVRPELVLATGGSAAIAEENVKSATKAKEGVRIFICSSIGVCSDAAMLANRAQPVFAESGSFVTSYEVPLDQELAAAGLEPVRPGPARYNGRPASSFRNAPGSPSSFFCQPDTRCSSAT